MRLSLGFLAVLLAAVLSVVSAFPDGYAKRAKYQVYRGPNSHKGGYGYDQFAPWGYYLTQPADNHAKGYH